MDGRVKNYKQGSPERAKVWREKSPKYRYNHNNIHQQQQKQSDKVPVVYYLCRNRQLEHPHFMEVPLSSSDGLYLRDVIERLNVLRGRGMAMMYSWSCKRNYKNGFVWHDLSNDDLILPVHGTEYVLKGSELFEHSHSGHLSPETVILQNQKALPEPSSGRSHDESSSSSSLNGRTTKTSNDDELSPPDQRPCSPNMFTDGKNSSWDASLSFTECKVYKNDGLADASTQTEHNVSNRSIRNRGTCNRGVSTNDGLFDSGNRSTHFCNTPQVKATPDFTRDYVSPPHSSPSASSSSGRTDTLESLIRADAKKLNSFRILEEEEFQMPSSNVRFKASNMILQFISCGSISVKDQNFGLVPTYKPRFSSSKLSSPMLSTSVMMGSELDRLTENPRLMGIKLEDKEYFSGSLIETSIHKEGIPCLKRSSSFDAERSAEKNLGSLEVKGEGNSNKTKCIPRAIKASLSKQPRHESLRSPTSDVSRVSSDRITAPSTPAGASKRMFESKSPIKPDTTRDDKENAPKIEESFLPVLGLSYNPKYRSSPLKGCVW